MGYLSWNLSKIATVVCWVLIALISITADAKPPSHSPIVFAPHCPDKCGNVSIPYPFGIGEGCYYKEHNQTHSSFEIRCNNNTSPPTPVCSRNYEVQNISLLEGELRSNLLVMSYLCYDRSGAHIDGRNSWQRLATFTFSSTKNVLVAVGCDTYAWFTGFRNGKEYKTGCMTTCVKPDDVIDGECSGIGCCQVSIPTGVRNISVQAHSYNNHSSVLSFNPCSVAFPVAKGAFRFNRSYLSLGRVDDSSLYDGRIESNDRIRPPVVINWSIGTESCTTAKANNKSYLCGTNAECYDPPEHESGYLCRCKPGFSGNPYLPLGCTDIDECMEANNDCQKTEYCFNTRGGYHCKCPKGYSGNGTKTDHCISNKHSFIPVLATADIDECKEANDCEKAEYCINTIGGYHCQCPKGYHGNGTANDRCISNTKPWLIPVLATAG